MTEPKILVWDLETTNLNATFGTILCVGYKWLDKKKVYVPTIFDTSPKNHLDDKGLVEAFAEVYNQADYSIAHYGGRFDLPMIQTKLLRYGLPPLKPIPLIDTWRTARNKLKLHSNRLATLAEYFQVEHSKTPISFDDWLHAAHGSKKAMKQVVLHCKMDVLVLEEVFRKLRPLIHEEPSRQLITGHVGLSCVSCGSTHITKQGFKVSQTRRYQQFQCQDCGKWFKSNKSEPLNVDLVGL